MNYELWGMVSLFSFSTCPEEGGDKSCQNAARIPFEACSNGRGRWDFYLFPRGGLFPLGGQSLLQLIDQLLEAVAFGMDDQRPVLHRGRNRRPSVPLLIDGPAGEPTEAVQRNPERRPA